MVAAPALSARKRAAEAKRATTALREARRQLEKQQRAAPPSRGGRRWEDVAYRIVGRVTVEDLFLLVLLLFSGWFMLKQLPESLAVLTKDRPDAELVITVVPILALLLYTGFVAFVIWMRRHRR